jgi:hypothetical protein
MNKIKLYMGIPTTGTIVDSQTYILREMEKKYGDRIEFIYPEKCVRRVFHDFARNAIVEDFMASGADILFFLDSDVVPPSDILEMVLQHERWEVAGAPYPIFITPSTEKRPQVVFTAYKGKGLKGLQSADIPDSGTEYIDGLATGCMFIKRHIFEKLKKPYFEFKYDKETRYMVEGEDLGFCRKVGDLGYKFYVDYSMVCKHYKSVCLLEVNNYAMEYAKRTVAQYDGMIRAQVAILEAHVKKTNDKAKNKLITNVSQTMINDLKRT